MDPGVASRDATQSTPVRRKIDVGLDALFPVRTPQVDKRSRGQRNLAAVSNYDQRQCGIEDRFPFKDRGIAPQQGLLFAPGLDGVGAGAQDVPAMGANDNLIELLW
jgi:hypothetical protein